MEHIPNGVARLELDAGVVTNVDAVQIPVDRAVSISGGVPHDDELDMVPLAASGNCCSKVGRPERISRIATNSTSQNILTGDYRLHRSVTTGVHVEDNAGGTQTREEIERLVDV